jgi:hypothetical protein
VTWCRGAQGSGGPQHLVAAPSGSRRSPANWRNHETSEGRSGEGLRLVHRLTRQLVIVAVPSVAYSQVEMLSFLAKRPFPHVQKLSSMNATMSSFPSPSLPARLRTPSLRQTFLTIHRSGSVPGENVVTSFTTCEMNTSDKVQDRGCALAPCKPRKEDAPLSSTGELYGASLRPHGRGALY